MSYLDEMKENEEERNELVNHQIFLKKQAKFAMPKMKKVKKMYNRKRKETEK